MTDEAEVDENIRLPTTSSRLNKLQHPCVRDLAWCLSSPAIYLLGHPCNQFFDDTKALWRWLHQLDKQPQTLLDSISKQRSHRLGIYFETLFNFALTYHLKPVKKLYALAVRHNNRTVGEYDFLLRLKGDKALRHVEVSIKFYLGLPTGDGRTCWTGLNRNDRLTDKRDKMQFQQLRLSRQPAAKQQLADLGEQVGPCHGLMMGRLFYPFDRPIIRSPAGATPNHLRGWWLRQSERDRLIPSKENPGLLVPLQRRQWLAPLSPAEAEQLAMEAISNQQSEQPGMSARLIKTPLGWREHDRGVVVEDDWLALETLE